MFKDHFHIRSGVLLCIYQLPADSTVSFMVKFSSNGLMVKLKLMREAVST